MSVIRVGSTMPLSDLQECDMRKQIISAVRDWAVFGAALVATAANAQAVSVPAPAKAPVLVTKQPKVIAPPDSFFHPCLFVLTGPNPDCPRPAQPVVCKAREKSCSALSKSPGRMVPL